MAFSPNLELNLVQKQVAVKESPTYIDLVGTERVRSRFFAIGSRSIASASTRDSPSRIVISKQSVDKWEKRLSGLRKRKPVVQHVFDVAAGPRR